MNYFLMMGAASAVLLSACSGGSSSGGSTGNPGGGSTTPSATIDGSNAKTYLGNALGVLKGVLDVPRPEDIVDAVSSFNNDETSPCTVAGSLTFRVDDNDSDNDISVGDVIKVTAVDCDEGNGEVFDAVLSYTVTAFPDEIVFDVSFSADYTQTSGAVDSIEYTGQQTDFDLANGKRYLFENGQLTATVGGVTATAQDLEVDYTQLNTNAVTASFAFSASGDAFDGEVVSVESATDFETTNTSGDHFFDVSGSTAGVFTISGGNSSTELTAANDGINVDIATDSDGDTVADDTESTTWSSVESSATYQ